MTVELDAGLSYTLTVFNCKSVQAAKKSVQAAWPYFHQHGRCVSKVPRKWGERSKTTIAIGL